MQEIKPSLHCLPHLSTFLRNHIMQTETYCISRLQTQHARAAPRASENLIRFLLFPWLQF